MAFLCLFQLYHLHNDGRLHKMLTVQYTVGCIESQSIVLKDKQSYYHPLHVSGKAHFAFVIQIALWYSCKRFKGATSFCRGQALCGRRCIWDSIQAQGCH